jgi:hypothetical protein
LASKHCCWADQQHALWRAPKAFQTNANADASAQGGSTANNETLERICVPMNTLQSMTSSGEPGRRQSPTGEWQFQGADGYWYDDQALAAAATPPATTRRSSFPPVRAMEPFSIATIIGSVLVVIGTLLPWATQTLGPISANRSAFQLGAHESITWVGPTLVLLAVVTAFIGLRGLRGAPLPRYLSILAVVLGVAMVVEIIIGYPKSPQGLSNLESFTVGIGFWVCLIGGIVVFVGALVMLIQSEDQPALSQATSAAVPNDLRNQPTPEVALPQKPSRAVVALGTKQEVHHDLTSWSKMQRRHLAQQLDGDQISYLWLKDELVTDPEDDERLDALFEKVCDDGE